MACDICLVYSAQTRKTVDPSRLLACVHCVKKVLQFISTRVTINLVDPSPI